MILAEERPYLMPLNINYVFSMKIAHIHVWDKKNKGDRAIVIAVQELLKDVFLGPQIIDFPVEALQKDDKKTLASLNSCDLIIIGGGGILYSYFLPFSIKMIKDIKTPLYLFGLGYIKEVDAPEWNQNNIDSVLALVNKAKRIGVRDYNTKRFLIQQGIDKEIKIVGDPAIYLQEKETNILDLEPKIKIGLNLNYSGWLGFGKWRKDILQAYREVALFFQKEYNAQIYYLQHHPGEDNIYKEIGIDNLIVVDLEPAEQKYIYSKMDLIVGMMLHVGVLSFGALSPEISVAYDIRNYGFAEVIDKPELVIDLDKLKTGILLRRAKDVFKNRKKYKDSFIDLKNNLINKEKKFLQLIIKDIK